MESSQALTTSSVAAENFAAYSRYSEVHSKWFKEAAKFERFYAGDQWNESDKEKLNAVKRPALTFNLIKRTVGVYIGEHIGRTTMFSYKPRTSEDEENIIALNQTVMNIQATSRYDDVERDVLTDGLITDRGFFDVRLNFDDHIRGEVRITAKDPRTILVDPSAKEYDTNSWNGVIETYWLTLDEVELYYGKDKADSVKSFAYANLSMGVDSVLPGDPVNTFGEGSGNSLSFMAAPESPSVVQVRIIDRQYRKLTLQKHFVNDNGDLRPIPDHWDDARIAAMAEAYNLRVIKKLVRRVRWTVTADNVVLHDDWSPYESFTIVGYFPYWRRGTPTGAVRDLIDPQEMYNKATSQELHVINTTANSGWLVEENSLANMEPDQLEQRGAETGLVIVYRRQRNAPEKIKPNQIPSGLEHLSQKGANAIENIAGVSPLMGTDSPEVSGVALKSRQGRALIPMRVPEANMDRSRELVAARVLEIIQRHYTESRVLRVYSADRTATDETMTVNVQAPDGRMLYDLTSGEYDIVVSSQPSRETFDDIQFAEALQMKEIGMAIPDDVIIRHSHLRDRQRIADRVQQLIGQAAPTPEEQQVAEMQAQMQMQAAMLQIEQLKAELDKTVAEARLSQAQAQNAAQEPAMRGNEMAIQYQTHIDKLKSDLGKHISNLQNKIDLAGVHAGAKSSQLSYTTASKALTSQQQMQNARDITAAQLATQSEIAKAKLALTAAKPGPKAKPK